MKELLGNIRVIATIIAQMHNSELTGSTGTFSDTKANLQAIAFRPKRTKKK